VVHVIRPFSMHKATEIVKAPKVYGFDTGFINYAKGRGQLRAEDVGFMWEHCVLNEMQAHLQTRSMNMKTINYWRDKRDHEIDFVMKHRMSHEITAIECKFQVGVDDKFLGSMGKNFKAFRQLYPEGENLVVATNIDHSFKRQYEDIIITFVSLKDLIVKLQQNK
jgi:predicted AAA+ superfamily ATPase